MTTASEASKNPVQQLRALLLQEDLNKLDALEKELEHLRDNIHDKEKLIETISPVLTAILENKISDARDDIADALAPVMGDAIKKQVEDSKEDVVDALYPVIGALIRKSISQSLKGLIDQVNEKVDRTLSLDFILKRAKSRVSGLSTGEMLINDSIQPVISNILFIHKKTGLLITSVSAENNITVDEDILSGMLSAIREFATTALKTGGSEALNEITYEDNRIVIQDGRYAYLAYVIKGVPNETFYTNIQKLETQLHNRYFKYLRDYEGELGKEAELQNLLLKFAGNREAQIPRRKYKNRMPLLVVLLLIPIFWFFAYRPYQENATKRERIHNAASAAGFSAKVTNQQIILFGESKNSQDVGLLRQKLAELAPGYIITDSLQYQLEALQAITEQPEYQTLFRDIHLTLDGNHLYLEGYVSSNNDKLLASAIVAKSAPVQIIINNLAIQSMTEKHIYFDLNQATLDSTAEQQITALVKDLEKMDWDSIWVTGHSDNIGNPDRIKRIALDRATVVANAIQQKITDTKRIGFSGMGNQLFLQTTAVKQTNPEKFRRATIHIR
jgi:outer membrane protein OmpA-like peptidoglycan-associated protein